MAQRDESGRAGAVRRESGRRVACAVSGVEVSARAARRLGHLPGGLQDRILRDHPDLTADAPLSRGVVDRYSRDYLESIIAAERGELSDLERDVASSLARHETVARDTEGAYDAQRSLGERMADHLAAFGGSWTFLAIFAGVLIGWMAANVVLAARAFDPYPFILLNLALSCLAAVQAPIIMMSQKRQEAKDRLRATSDYRVNLKAELEIRHLHEKLDHLLSHQWERLAEIQRLQLELMQERGK